MATIAQMVSKALVRIDMGTGNMPRKAVRARRLSWGPFYPVPNRIELGQLGLSELFTALF
jgi:hypothetical protein